MGEATFTSTEADVVATLLAGWRLATHGRNISLAALTLAVFETGLLAVLYAL